MDKTKSIKGRAGWVKFLVANNRMICRESLTVFSPKWYFKVTHKDPQGCRVADYKLRSLALINEFTKSIFWIAGIQENFLHLNFFSRVVQHWKKINKKPWSQIIKYDLVTIFLQKANGYEVLFSNEENDTSKQTFYHIL